MNTGGPAFPTEYFYDQDTKVERMPTEGMTLRDYFAAKAMQGLIAQSAGTALGSRVEIAAEYAYAAADAMLKAKEQ